MLVQTETGWTDKPMKVKDLIKALQDFDPEANVEMHCVSLKEDCTENTDKYVMIDRTISNVTRGWNKNYNKNDWNSPYWDDSYVIIHSKGLI